MKLYKLSFALLLGIATLSSCDDKLDVVNPNQQTSGSFGFTAGELEESIIAAYNHTRMEGTYARVGYNIDVCRGDEAWNSSQVWYLPFDDLDEPITDEIGQWSWRDWYYTINVTNFVLSRCGDDNAALNDQMRHIKGQALFIRALSYYNLAGYYQNPILITDYDAYSSLDGLYAPNSTYDQVLDQVEADFAEAMQLLPSKDAGGEWAHGRATSGAAAGFYARALMMRHKYNEALTVLKAIIAGQYGTYKLMSGHRSTPVPTPHKAMPSRVTSVPATSVDGLISPLLPGSIISSRQSVPTVANSTRVSIGPSVHTRPTGKDSNMETCAMALS